MSNVMIDLETMGTSANAAIIAIGAVEFDFEGNLGHQFYQVVDLADSVKSGGVMDASTVLWWMKQSDDARKELSIVGEDEYNVLLDFDLFLSRYGEDVKIWGNGASFDNVILANAYRRNDLNIPWKYYNDRCYRTMKSLAPHIKIERTGIHHNALSDAISQANHLVRIMAND